MKIKNVLRETLREVHVFYNDKHHNAYEIKNVIVHRFNYFEKNFIKVWCSYFYSNFNVMNNEFS